MAVQDRIRRTNLSRILHLLRRVGSASQAELALRTGLQPSTVSNLVRELRSGAYVVSLGRGASSDQGGKRPTLLALNGARGVYVGLLWEAGAVAWTVVDLAGDGRASASAGARYETLGASQTPEEVLTELVRRATDDVPDDVPILGVGLAVGSIVDRDGAIRPSADFSWTVREPGLTLRRLFGVDEVVPVVVENDANCVALSAVRRRIGHGDDSTSESLVAALITDAPLSAGVGLLIDDRLIRGRTGSSGELLPAGGDHSIDDVDRALAAALRLMDPDEVVLARPETVSLSELPRSRDALGDAPLYEVDPVSSVLDGAIELAFRASVHHIVQGDFTHAR